MSAFVECGHCGLWHNGPCPRIKAIRWRGGAKNAGSAARNHIALKCGAPPSAERWYDAELIAAVWPPDCMARRLNRVTPADVLKMLDDGNIDDAQNDKGKAR